MFVKKIEAFKTVNGEIFTDVTKAAKWVENQVGQYVDERVKKAEKARPFNRTDSFRIIEAIVGDYEDILDLYEFLRGLQLTDSGESKLPAHRMVSRAKLRQEKIETEIAVLCGYTHSNYCSFVSNFVRFKDVESECQTFWSKVPSDKTKRVEKLLEEWEEVHNVVIEERR